MSESPNRRTFLGAALAGAAVATTARAAANDKLVVGVMGTGGRGTHLAKSFASLPNTEVAYVCDADEKRAGAAGDEVAKGGKSKPKVVADFRRPVLPDRPITEPKISLTRT